MGDNINGPSLIRVPTWLERPLARYYLYFAHHNGRYIRLALADNLQGPWQTYEHGVLPLETSLFGGHIASPDVHVDDNRHEIRLYYHGVDQLSATRGAQATRVAVSDDGLHFKPLPQLLGDGYFRVFPWAGWMYALAMPGIFYRSRDGLAHFERGPKLFCDRTRHTAIWLRGTTLNVFYTRVGDCPERIMLATIELHPDWTRWAPSDPVVLLEPELPYEGGDLPRVPSRRGLVSEPVCQVRDPAIFNEAGRTYLLYTVAGERGIAIAELND
jgi:hypothetical protein